MNLIRVAIIALLVWLVYRMVRAAFSKPRVAAAKGKPALSTDMVRCHHCGIHIPKDEALQAGDHFYCSPEHREQDSA